MYRQNKRPSFAATAKNAKQNYPANYKELLDRRQEIHYLREDVNELIDIVKNLCPRIEKLEGRRR